MQDANSINRRVWNLLFSNLASFGVLAVFIGLAFAVAGWLHPVFSTTGLVLTGMLMALIPAGVWLFFFYRQDRREPEPKGMVLQVVVLGGLGAAAVAIPLVEGGFDVSAWMYSSPWVALGASILVIGFVQEFVKYAAVRFSVYETDEFNERTDGVIYAIAAGLGFAVVLNAFFIYNTGGADLGMAAIRLTLTSLAQASFAGITGYFLACEKLDRRPAWHPWARIAWMPLGVLISAVLNGLFFYLWGSLSRATISTSGAFVNPWAGLILAAILALVTVAGLTWLIQRDQARQSSAVEEENPGITKTAALSAWLVVILTAAAVFGGWLIKNGLESATRDVERSGVAARYPAGWELEKGMASEPLLFMATDPLKPAQRYLVTEMPAPVDGKLDTLALQRNIQRGGQLTLYRIFDQTAVEYHNARAGYMVHFAYVDPRQAGVLPLVVEGIDYYLDYNGKILVVTMEDDARTFAADQPRFMHFLDSIRVTGGE